MCPAGDENSGELVDAAPVAGIVLAAGCGSRMGRVKQLLPFKGVPLLAHAVASARDSALEPVIVVLGHHAGLIRREVDLGGTRIVVNPDYRAGQSSSLQKGLEAVPPACAAALFLLGDQPLISPALIARIIGRYRRTSAPVVVPTFKGRRGNPVLIARSLFHLLAGLTGDRGGRGVFQAVSHRIETVPVEDPGIHLDVDTWQDYLKLTSP